MLFIACSGQEKLSVYFKSGHSKVEKELLDQIDGLPAKYAFSELDSIVFIGYSDSIGNYKANLRLSEKRAKNVAAYLKKDIPEKTSVFIRSEGEKNKQIETKDRRVDIVLYFPEITEAEIENQEINDTVKNQNCYYVNYALLAECHKRNVIKGKKKFISLETYYLPHQSIINYYGSINNKGEFIYHKIKWSKKIVSISKKKNETFYYTLIPEDDYKRYEVFTIGKTPCTNCAEKFNSTFSRRPPDTCIVLDRHSSRTVNIKRSSFNRSFVKMRIPVSSVDSVNNYFLLNNNQLKITWKKGKGRKNRGYLFANVPVNPKEKGYNYFDYLGYIYKKVECCSLPPPVTIIDPIQCLPFQRHFCGFKNYTLKRNIVIGLELGNNYQQDFSNQYAAISIMKEKKHSTKGLLLGIDIHKKFYSALRYQKYFFTFKYSDLNPFFTWRHPSYRPQKEKFFGRFYYGAELKNGKNNFNQQFIENNAHVGLVSIYNNNIYLRGFAQYGIGYDYLRNNSKKPYPVFQMGITWQFLGF